MNTKISDQNFDAFIGSDIDRDGMYLRAQEPELGILATILAAILRPNRNKRIAEIFYSDVDHTMSFTAYRPDIPLALVEEIIVIAKRRLVPTVRQGG